MRGKLRMVLALAAAMAAFGAGLPAGANSDDWIPVRYEEVSVYDSAEGTEGTGVEVGTARLWRHAEGLRVQVHTHDLRRGGVYTFWAIGLTDSEVEGKRFDVSFHKLGGVVVDAYDGHGFVDARIPLGAYDPHYTPEGAEAAFVNIGALTDVDVIVRVDIAYHGRATHAGDDLDVWLNDYWTGEDYVCDSFPFPGPDMVRCPTEQAAQFNPAG